MKLNSKYFDSIRVKPEQDRTKQKTERGCEWPDCEQPGKFPAPKGRDNEGEYHYFCVNHVREYNKSFNYFQGMKDSDAASALKRSRTGDRPTWKLGQNSWANVNGGRNRKPGGFGPAMDDAHGVLGDKAGDGHTVRPRRAIRSRELKALHILNLDETAGAPEIKAQYKVLVKRLHPDANSGSRANEEKFREIIRAYDVLRKSGFC